MADRVLFIAWGENVHGREERGLEIFNEAMGILGRMQQEGRIEKFDVALLDPNGGDLEGYVAVHMAAPNKWPPCARTRSSCATRSTRRTSCIGCDTPRATPTRAWPG